MIPIPTKIINLEKRKDRRSYIEKEFVGRHEFDVSVIRAVEDRNPALGLYKTVMSIVRQAKLDMLPFVLICEDDHQFTSEYSRKHFMNGLEFLDGEDAEIFLGGVSWFDFYIEKKSDFYLINAFTGTQFMVIYSRFYDNLLATDFPINSTIDRWMAEISDNVYVSVPMLSIQKDFGYSDATEKNNKSGSVSKLFEDTIARWKTLKQINDHIRRFQLSPLVTQRKSIGSQLPTFIINLKSRVDRLESVLHEFKGKSEFDIHIVEACQDPNGAVGLWKSVRNIVKQAKERRDEVILLCEDDHVFCHSYDKKKLFFSIYYGAYLGAVVMLGGVTNTRQVIPVNDHLCWVDCFQSTQFTIIFNAFFDEILSVDFEPTDSADLVISNATANKYVIHPFISVQKDFGYSDIPLQCLDTKEQSLLFDDCGVKIDRIRKSLTLDENIKLSSI